ncbi:MAG: carboxypeptidase regulatory-like domain-containing protein, partial [Bacteroidales bacterium]
MLGRTHGVTVNGTVHDGAEPLSFAAVTLTSDGVEYNVVCNVGGEFTFHNLEVGEYVVRTSYISYNNYISNVSLHRDTQLDICMVRNINMIEELVVTGVEAKGLTTSTVINRDAINLLQPSSFSDILELLPGGTSSAPSLTSANTIALREVGISSDDYSISSLGTAFLIDGARISTAANMQYTTGLSYSIGNSIYTDASVSTVNAGVDMRNISTDQIET